MPDWSYRTVLRPLMLAMGPERSRRLAVSTLATLSRVPYGVKLIDFLGHMRPDPRLRTRAGSLELAGPMALGGLIDPRGEALPALSHFGVGLIEVGPVAEQGSDGVPQWRVDLQQRTIGRSQPIVVSVEDVAGNLERHASHAPVCVRIAKQDGAAVRRIVERLQEHAAMFVVDAANVDDVRESLRTARPESQRSGGAAQRFLWSGDDCTRRVTTADPLRGANSSERGRSVAVGAGEAIRKRPGRARGIAGERDSRCRRRHRAARGETTPRRWREHSGHRRRPGLLRSRPDQTLQ